MMDFRIFKIDFNDFNLSTKQFDRQSELHGIKHSYRVMLHCLRLGILTGQRKEATNAFFGAYIHDMARTHDGYCTIHGTNSANYKLPLYQDLFFKYGASIEDLKTIQQIVAHHSLPAELPGNSSLYNTLAILKDADALDRIRLGKNDLNPKYLRIEATHKSITFGEELFFRTNKIHIGSFQEVIDLALTIENSLNFR